LFLEIFFALKGWYPLQLLSWKNVKEIYKAIFT